MKFLTYFLFGLLFNLPSLIYCQNSKGSELEKIPDSIENPIYQTRWYFNKSSNVAHTLDNVPLALEYFNKGYEIAANYKNDSLQYVGKYYKGVITISRGKKYYDEAEILFKDVIKGFRTYKDYENIGRAYNQLASIYHRLSDDAEDVEYEEALKYYDLAFKYISKSNNPNNAATPVYNKTLIYLKQEKYEKALESAKYVDEIFYNAYNGKKNKNKIVEHKIKYLIGYCYLNLNKYNRGISLINSSLKEYKKQKYYSGIEWVYKDLIKYSKKNKNYLQALSYTDSLVKYNEKYYQGWKDKNDKYVDELKTMENISLQLDLANKEVELKSEKNKKLTWSLILTLFIVVSLFIISLLLRNKNKTLEFLKIQAEQGERQKSKFIAMISHEMRTPLNALIGFSNLLIEESPSEHQKKHLHSIQSSADYLLNLVNNVLNLNETEQGKLTIEKHSIELEPFINRLADSFYLQTNNKSNKLIVNYDDKIPLKLKSDSLKLTQVLKNLLNNACKFTKDGNIWLNVILFEDNSDHCMVNFEVKDTGIGISEDKYATLFEAFSNDSLDIKKSHDGTGIGLSIVQKILQAFDSEIIFDSKVGQGSSFSFVLKLYKLPEEVRPEQRADVVELKGKKVLVVEDNKINQMLAMKMLKSVDALPEVCANGLLGLEAVKSKPVGYYDFILMDIHMPVMDGYEATILIRNLDKNLPIVALTATNLKNDKAVLDEKGFNAVIYKPYEVSHVYDVMNKFVK